MTIYMIALAFLCLFYGLFWNNRSARELVRLENPGTKRDQDATRGDYP